MRTVLVMLMLVTLSPAPVLSAAKEKGRLFAQAPASSGAPRPRGDSTRARDTLPDLEVRVTRTAEERARLPMAVGVLAGTAVRRAQLTAGLDEALSRLPGVVVLNRYNYSLDQRVSLRGAGSRANFGLRGVKVLLDGVPQTLPDGQSQLSNLELGLIDRVEVLTGSAGALYGNASGGVLSFSTERPDAPFGARLRVTGGSFGTLKWSSMASAARGRTSALAAISRLTTDGFRQHGRAEALQASGKLDVTLDRRSSLGLSVAFADAPHAQNPGALNQTEYLARRDSAVGTNILRGADKDVSQQQAAVRYRWLDGTGAEVEATLFGLRRDLVNPLATPPPAPAPLDAGTYNTIDRLAGGARLAGTLPLHRGARPVRATLGVDLQKMRDLRRNERSDGGAPTGVVLADQRETVSELGPFAQIQWAPSARVLLLGAARWDRLAFRVNDRFLTDGVDNSGERIMQAASASAGVSLLLAAEAVVFANTATSFESPTTTELVNQANGTAGFNTALGPQRSLSVELGTRGEARGGWQYSLSVFTTGIRDAIIQAREQDGRAFFQNAGRVRNRGLEAGLAVQPAPWLRIQSAYTLADYEFTEYRIPNGPVTDTLDGKRLAGVPKHFFRATATVTRGGMMVELDQMTAGEMYGDDRNTLPVQGWGAGVTSLRASASFTRGRVRLAPFGAVNNLFDRRYVGSVNINGFGGRVLEPAPGRHGYLGIEMAWAKR